VNLAEDLQNPVSSTILLVEDNLLNQKVALLLLRRLGMRTKIACNGAEAVDFVKKYKFDAILMDCHMPIMDGFQASVAIRKWEASEGSFTPIIAVTALGMGGDRERCIAAGMNDYISKPMDREVLQSKLNYWTRATSTSIAMGAQRKFLRSGSTLSLVNNKPLDLDELREFYEAEGDQLEQMLLTFINDTEDMLARLIKAMADKNSKAVSGYSHEIRASCDAIGAKFPGRLCLFLEQAANQYDWIEADETYKALEQSFNSIKTFIQSEIKSKSLLEA